MISGKRARANADAHAYGSARGHGGSGRRRALPCRSAGVPSPGATRHGYLIKDDSSSSGPTRTAGDGPLGSKTGGRTP